MGATHGAGQNSVAGYATGSETTEQRLQFDDSKQRSLVNATIEKHLDGTLHLHKARSGKNKVHLSEKAPERGLHDTLLRQKLS